MKDSKYLEVDKGTEKLEGFLASDNLAKYNSFKDNVSNITYKYQKTFHSQI